jgi:hypothetical protein
VDERVGNGVHSVEWGLEHRQEVRDESAGIILAYLRNQNCFASAPMVMLKLVVVVL